MSVQEFAINVLVIAIALTFAGNFCNLFFYSVNKGLNRIPEELVLVFPRTLLFLLVVEALIFCYLVGTA